MDTAVTLKHRIDELLGALASEGPEGVPPALDEFARRLLSRASADFLEGRTARDLAEQVRASYRLLERTGRNEIAVRVASLGDRPQEFLVTTVMEDCAFIVDTLREYLHGEGYSVVQLLHPVLQVERDDAGQIVDLTDRGSGGRDVSVTSIIVAGTPDRGSRDRIRREIESRLEKVREATSDFDAMMDRCAAIARDLEEIEERLPWRRGEFEEIRELLEWLRDGNFVFLGYRVYDLVPRDGDSLIRVRPDSGLGILRNEEDSRFADPMPLSQLPVNLRARVVGGPLLIFSKTNSESPVHRRARMDYVGIKSLGPDGEITGERRLLGLLTARAYSQDASTIPILRRKLREILEAEGSVRGSHDYSMIHRIFNSMPKEELFLSTVPELLRAINAVMEAEGAGEIRLTAQPDPLGRGVNVMVMMPAAKFSGDIRRQIQQELVDTYRGKLLNYHLSMGGGDQARLHFYLDSELEDVEEVDTRELQERVRASTRSWQERLEDTLEERHEPERAQQLVERHRADFSPEYMATMDVGTAAADILRLEELERTHRQQVVVEPLEREGPGGCRLKIFAPRGRLVLSDVMPTLENLGFRVLQAEKYEVGRPGPSPVTIHTYDVTTPESWGVDLEAAERRVAEALLAVQKGFTEDDRLNSLVLSAGLDWWQVALLRAYANYAFRIDAVTSRVAVRRPLTEYPRIARLLYEVFDARLRPADDETGGGSSGSDRRTAPRIRRFRDSLSSVRGIEDDGALRQLLELVLATVRTNFFQRRARDRSPPTVAIKFDCRRIEAMVRPRPRFEVYVNGAATEGAHLRMGTVARGGIRWSDRTEDFRVEVLGLAKTQQVKNAVIVPAGAKGAFVAKNLPEEPEARRDAGISSYRDFIRALLDVTDNVVDGQVVSPPETRVLDGDDPYLVVAADKGTATLSDTANALAEEYDFWLGDAFASGGSHGYDHKKLGITARGVWECVKRHLREMGRDPEEESLTVVGIGDMSGDVFGNGMLLSRNIRLLAAFDHRHVFLDPTPDPESSYRERKRLFEMESSSWEDYDRDVISPGGGIYERGAKSLSLSPEVREWLGLGEEEGSARLNSDALIRAILRAPVDLLWNGGIGTYVKASGETHAEVSDPANDATRVNARELGAAVVGEGGNLGLTQRARVEYALDGGRCNTDALDNSAGVDMSDHEVNLKILMAGAVHDGEMSMEERNARLRDVEDEVAGQVLRDNYLQSLAVSLEEHRTREQPAEFREVLHALDRAGVLDRQVEDLPTTEELAERQEAGRYLTRPELAVVMAHAKLHLRRSLSASEIIGAPGLRDLVFEYFPRAAREAAGRERVLGHWLAPRIVATQLANLFVNRMGATAGLQLVRETGRRQEEIVRTWYEAYRVGDAEELYRTVESLDGRVPAGLQNRWFLKISRVLESATRWLLANADPDRGIQETLDRYSGPVRELLDGLPELVTEEQVEEMKSRSTIHEMDGVDAAVADRLVRFDALDAVLPVAQLAHESGHPASLVGRIYFGLTGDVDFPWLQDRLARAASQDVWEQRAAKTLSLQLDEARARITSRVISEADVPSDAKASGEAEGQEGSEASPDPEEALASYRDRHADELDRVRDVLADVRAVEEPSLAALTVAVHAVTGHARLPQG